MEFNKPDELNNEPDNRLGDSAGATIPIDFSAFILSLSSSALVGMGELPDPISREKAMNLSLAKQMIDVINMLKDKTSGNLSREEDELMKSLCSELKMKYIQSINFK